MSRMIDLIRHSAVPANLMRAAAHGALSLPPGEMLEVLVYLTRHPLFGSQARLTLAGWDEASALAVVSDARTAPEVLDYYAAPENQRPPLMPSLLENPAVAEPRLQAIARTASGELVPILLSSPRVCSLPGVLRALLANPELSAEQVAEVNAHLQRVLSGDLRSDNDGDVLDPEIIRYLGEHATEIAAAERELFHLIGWTEEEQAELTAAHNHAGVNLSTAAARALGAAARTENRERLSTLQKISRLSVGERVQLALKGNKEDRFILIRDGAKVVSSAVLESPKITDSEVEMYASMKNLGENVLRGIASSRKFMRSYAVKRLLSSNPRCPIDIALPIVKELLVVDLKNLSNNKNVPDTVRRFAYKIWREKSTAR